MNNKLLKMYVHVLLTVTPSLLLIHSSKACDQNDIQLVGGERSFEGRVEVCDDGEWKTVCNRGWDNKEAKVVCRQLGFPEDTRTNRVSYATKFFGNANTSQGIISTTGWKCSGSEQQLLRCNKNNPSSNCDHWRDAGVYCFGRNTVKCKEGEIRLSQRGEGEFSGQVEICLNGFWGTVCDDGWDWNDATTVCKQLEISDKGIPTRGAYFGVGSGPIHLSMAQCESSDTALINCTIDKTGINYCEHSEDAGVICKGKDICEDWDVRLVGGENEREGRVEICYNGVWGTVCNDGWDEVDANMVCTQLGYEQPGIIPIIPFGAGEGPIILDNVTCNKCHSNLSQCVHPVDIGVYDYDQQNTAGVICPKLSTTTSTDISVTSRPEYCSTVLTTVKRQSALLGSVSAALAVGGIVLFGLVLVTVVIVGKRKKNKDGTANSKEAMDNPVYEENICFGSSSGINQSIDDSERVFQNHLYSDIGPDSINTNTTNKPAQDDTLRHNESAVVVDTLYEIPCNSIPVVYDMPPTLESVNADYDEDNCYSVLDLGLTGSSQPKLNFQHREQLSTGDDSDYSLLQHK